MRENFELVQDGLRILHSSMSAYIGMKMSTAYRDWWREVLNTLGDQRDLPLDGSYSELVDSLDVLNCLRLLDRKAYELFNPRTYRSCRTWANELMGVRNEVAHRGQQDAEQPWAERALDTMVRLCAEIDADGVEEIREIYNEMRARAGDVQVVEYAGLAQPASESKRGSLTEGSLLQLVGTDVVIKTDLTRKVTFGGKTVAYPVYKIRLDYLYYNDQNDRIATWISRYEAENGAVSLADAANDVYNGVIEGFIVESNPEAIQKTQKNIALVGQREPGVALADGRIVDGNRRFTCLRRLQQVSEEPLYFETVIIDMDIQADRKQIKLLELAIQHGEEKKVDYDPIEFAIGTYRDVVQTGLLTVEEYAAGTNEPVAEVRKRLEVAQIVHEFLGHIRIPEQYYAAREYQVYSLFLEMLPLLKQVSDEERTQLKQIAFNNAMLKAEPDQRKFIRDIKKLIKNNTYAEYFAEQQELAGEIYARFDAVVPRSKADVDKFAADNSDLADKLQRSMERALLRSRSQQLIARPGENVSKCISLLLDVDPRLFGKLDVEEREALKAQLEELSRLTEGFRKKLG